MRMLASIVEKAHVLVIKMSCNTNACESLVWTKPERNWSDKMWLDSGVGEFDSGVRELYFPFLFRFSAFLSCVCVAS